MIKPVARKVDKRYQMPCILWVEYVMQVYTAMVVLHYVYNM